ncbi:MAG: hypothetical protein D6780_06590 [Candidatus Dadabacteria bacterium]|nr:MAG: hypothetical protein D6780_06590 [Candidatus Dadabacteria bacterium]
MTFAVFLICAFIFLGVGHLAAKYSREGEEDYLLANRSLGKYFLGLSAGATANSGFIAIGGVGLAYTMGSKVFLLTLGFFLGEWAFWTFFAGKTNKIARETDSYTVPSLIGSSVKSHYAYILTSVAAVITVIFIGTYASAQFIAAGKALNSFFNLDVKSGAMLVALFIIPYCVFGGFRASVWTDIAQAAVVVFTCVVVLIGIYIEGGGFSNLLSQLNKTDPNFLSLLGSGTVWEAVKFTAGFVVLGFAFALSNPHVLVRVLSGKSSDEARLAKWVYLLYVYGTWVAMCIFGVAAKVLLPHLSDPEQALPIFAEKNFSPLIVGIILAGIFSTIASTADSQLLVCSNSLVKDLSPRFYKLITTRLGFRAHQLATLLFGLLVLLLAVSLGSPMAKIVLFAVGVLAGSIGVAVLVVLLNMRRTVLSLSSAMVVGVITAIAWRMLGLKGIFNESGPAILAGLLVNYLLAKRSKN